MDIPRLIAVLELADLCKTKARALISGNKYLDDDALDKACHYYLALRTTIITIEEVIKRIDVEDSFEVDSELLATLYLSIQQCSEVEEVLTQRISMISH
tara:strand:- start:406 stop:702 length:297 start_codon:yes stop_codon:yes gene_type:complete